MAEDTAALPVVPDEAARGRTTIADKVVDQLAARAALEVPGVVRHTPGPDALSAVTSDFPRVSSETAGDRLSLDLKVALDWDATAHEVAATVRGYVAERLEKLTGKTVDRVDVTVAALVSAPAGQGRRVE